MKTSKKLLMVLLTVALSINVLIAGQRDLRLTVTDPVFTSKRSLEFDIVISINSDQKGSVRYSAGQYFLEFDPQIANGGMLDYKLTGTDLPEALQPVNASVSGNLLRLASNMIQSENLPVISSSGILVARMRLETSARSFANLPLDLKWTGEENKFRTKICTLTGSDLIPELTDLTEFKTTQETSSNSSFSKEIPKGFSIAQNYPNPFNPVTMINYEIPAQSFVSIKVYDMAGREINVLVNEDLKAGSYSVAFNGSGLSSGLYFYKIEAGSFSVIKKMLLIK